MGLWCLAGLAGLLSDRLAAAWSRPKYPHKIGSETQNIIKFLIELSHQMKRNTHKKITI